MHYTYLIGSLIALAFWAILYASRKDVRREMLVVSIASVPIGLILSGLAWTLDWWVPQTITGTRVGIEDVFYGFGVGGVAAAIFQLLSRQRLKYSGKKLPSNKALALWLLVPVITIAGTYLLKWHSFPSTMAGLLIPSAIMLVKRKDLIIPALATGAIMAVLGEIGFLMLNALSPGFVQQYWLMSLLSGTSVLGYPIEDLACYFGVGVFLSLIYKYWQNAELVRA